MANKPYMQDARQREARERAYKAAPTLGKQFPWVEEAHIEMRFTRPDGKLHSSPHSRIFQPDMQAFFEFLCPEPDCSNGGFNLAPSMGKALQVKKPEPSGVLQCDGSRGGNKCQLDLHFKVTPRLHARNA